MRIYPDAREDQSHRVVGIFAAFDQEVKDLLPPESGFKTQNAGFRATLLDLHTGKMHEVVQDYAAYDYEIDLTDCLPKWSLNTFFYNGHWCGCHRRGLIREETPVDENCESGRFIVLRFWHPSIPDVCLFREFIRAAD